MEKRNSKLSFHVLKLVATDVSKIMDFFIQHPDVKKYSFVFFHKGVPTDEIQEKLFVSYIEGLSDILGTFSKKSFTLREPSYESYMNAIQIRYTIEYHE